MHNRPVRNRQRGKGTAQSRAPIGRRAFLRATGTAVVAGTFGSACGETTSPPSSGFVRAIINGLPPDISSGGTVEITGIQAVGPLVLELPGAASTELAVPVGVFHVRYTPPDGYILAPGESGEADIQIVAGQTTEVVVSVVVAPPATLRVAVTGLAPGAPSGGSVSIERTDVPQAPQTVPMPASGSLDVQVDPGAYEITYTPPATYRLADGETNPETALVDADEVATVVFVVAPIQTQPTAGLVFSSDWSTGIGRSAASLRDADKALPWDAAVGNGSLNTVIAAAGLGFPSIHAFQVIAEWSGNTQQLMYSEQVRLAHANGHIPIPSVGESIFYRWYWRCVVPNSIDTSTGAVPHPVQDGPSASTMNWMWEIPVHTDGTFTPALSFAAANPYPNNRWRTRTNLPKNQTFRIELQIHRVGANAFTPHIRIFNSANQQVMADADFYSGAGVGSATLAGNPQLNINSEAYFAGRPRGSQLAAWASHQSSELTDRTELEARFAKADERFTGQAVPCPPYWGGYRLIPSSIEAIG